MNIKLYGDARTIIQNPESRHNYFGWPSIARLQSGTLAAVCSGYRRGHICPFGKAVMALSFDEGETWTGAWPVIDTPLDDRDAGICVFGENGVIVTSFNNSLQAQRNWNPVSAELDAEHILRNTWYQAYINTVTQEEEAKYLGAEFRVSLDGGKTFGPISRSPVTSPHGPTALRDGTVLWVGRVFSDDDMFREDSGVHAYTVAPDGSMEKRGEIPTVYTKDGKKVFFSEPHAIQLPDGRILCHMRSEQTVEFGTYQTESADGGFTWSAPEMLLPEHGGAPCHLLLHSSGVLISAYGYREKPYGVRVMLSRDLGRTWQKDLILFEGVSDDLGYPCTVERTDGSLLTVFYARDTENGPDVIKQIRWNIAAV